MDIHFQPVAHQQLQILILSFSKLQQLEIKPAFDLQLSRIPKHIILLIETQVATTKPFFGKTHQQILVDRGSNYVDVLQRDLYEHWSEQVLPYPATSVR